MIKQETLQNASARTKSLVEVFRKQHEGKKLSREDERLIVWAAGDPSTLTVSRKELMDLLTKHGIGLTPGRLSQIASEGFLAKHDYDVWPVVDTLAGLARWWKKGGRDTKEGMQKARLENQKLESEQRRIEIAKARKEVIQLTRVDQLWGYYTSEIMARLRTADIPEKVRDEILRGCEQIPVERYFDASVVAKETP